MCGRVNFVVKRACSHLLSTSNLPTCPSQNPTPCGLVLAVHMKFVKQSLLPACYLDATALIASFAIGYPQTSLVSVSFLVVQEMRMAHLSTSSYTAQLLHQLGLRSALIKLWADFMIREDISFHSFQLLPHPKAPLPNSFWTHHVFH